MFYLLVVPWYYKGIWCHLFPHAFSACWARCTTYIVSFSLLCHFSHTVLLPVSFVVELLLSIFFPCHAIYHRLFFFLKSTVSDCIYWINRSFFSVSSHDAMTTSLGCSHVLFMSSLFPDVIHRICFGVTIEILSLCLSLLTFQYRIFFCLCLSYFLCQKTPYLCN